jgi:hypothetical protein
LAGVLFALAYIPAFAADVAAIASATATAVTIPWGDWLGLAAHRINNDRRLSDRLDRFEIRTGE